AGAEDRRFAGAAEAAGHGGRRCAGAGADRGQGGAQAVEQVAFGGGADGLRYVDLAERPSRQLARDHLALRRVVGRTERALLLQLGDALVIHADDLPEDVVEVLVALGSPPVRGPLV